MLFLDLYLLAINQYNHYHLKAFLNILDFHYLNMR